MWIEPEPNEPMITGILTAAQFTPAGQDYTPDGESPTRAPSQRTAWKDAAARVWLCHLHSLAWTFQVLHMLWGGGGAVWPDTGQLHCGCFGCMLFARCSPCDCVKLSLPPSRRGCGSQQRSEHAHWVQSACPVVPKLGGSCSVASLPATAQGDLESQQRLTALRACAVYLQITETVFNNIQRWIADGPNKGSPGAVSYYADPTLDASLIDYEPYSYDYFYG